jgi:hypothetical protein
VARKRTKAADRRAATEQRRDRVGEQLDALYGELPKLRCKGKCWKSCARVLMAPGERDRVEREEGIRLPTVDEMRRTHRTTCPALKDHRCSVYAVRPLMCRLWGIEETMRCPFGCVPEGGWLSESEATRLWLRAYVVAGWPVEKKEKLTRKQLADRLRRHEATMVGPRQVQPSPAELERPRNPLRRWRRSK